MNKIKNKKIPHSWNILKIKSKMIERGQSTPLTHIHDRLSVKLILTPAKQ